MSTFGELISGPKQRILTPDSLNIPIQLFGFVTSLRQSPLAERSQRFWSAGAPKVGVSMKARLLARVRGASLLLFFSTLQCVLPGSSASAATVNVAAGESIQAAINTAVAGNEIIVAPGTYFEAIDFLGKAITLRSSGGPLVTVIDGSATNGSVVQCVNGEGPGTILEGFTITGGSANNGGGMHNLASSPTINQCIFTGNTAADRGGGMYNREGSPTITGSVFSQNSSGAMGGGMFNIEGATPTISDCLFTQNTSNKGGGMRNYLNSHATITNSVVSYNVAGEEGGGMDNRKNSNVLVMSCEFIGNSAASGGGGMHNYVGRAVATGDPTIKNSLFVGNDAPSGSAMRNNDPSPRIINSTFAYNTGGAAIRSRNGSMPELINSIVWGNPAGSLSWAKASSMPIASYSDIEGGHPGVANIDADPLFASVAGPDGNPATLDDNDYRLLPGSPAINAGTNNLPDLPATDLDGNPRIAGGTVDIGAYEFGAPCSGAAECDDGNICTTDSCEDGLCRNVPLCNDGNACTTDSCDPTGPSCTFDPLFCGDEDTCTIDGCDSAIGCFTQPLDCPVGEICSGGVCSQACSLGQKGDPCMLNTQCCSNKCRGPLSNRTCKG